MKLNVWNPQSAESNVATLPEPANEAGAPQFDEIKYQPRTPTRNATPPRNIPPTTGQNSAIREIQEAVREHSAWVTPLEQELGRVIVGQKHLVNRLLVALVTNVHVLLEGVPGLAKTLALKTLSQAYGGSQPGILPVSSACKRAISPADPAIPIAPLTAVSNRPSQKNCPMMLLFVAPSAFRKPISLTTSWRRRARKKTSDDTAKSSSHRSDATAQFLLCSHPRWRWRPCCLRCS